MTLITRITRLFKADIHGILDCLEEPEAIVKQAIRDMEEEIAKNSARMKELENRKIRAMNLEAATENQLQDIKRQIEVAFEAKDDVLAKSIVRRRLEAEKRLLKVRSEREQNDRERAELEKIIETQKSQLQGVVEKLNLFSECRSKEAPVCTSSQGGAVSEDDIEIAFIEEKRRRSGEPVSAINN